MDCGRAPNDIGHLRILGMFWWYTPVKPCLTVEFNNVRVLCINSSITIPTHMRFKGFQIWSLSRPNSLIWQWDSEEFGMSEGGCYSCRKRSPAIRSTACRLRGYGECKMRRGFDLTWWILGRPPCRSIGPRWGCLNAGRGQLNAGDQLRAGGGRALWRCRMEPVFKNMNGIRMHYIRWQGILFQYSPGKKGKFIWILMGSKSSVFIIMGGSCSWVCFP